MVNFDCVYNIINDEEKRNVVTALIKEIEIYRNDESEYPLKRIGLNFPVFKDGGEVTELLWDKGNTVETVVLLSQYRDKSTCLDERGSRQIEMQASRLASLLAQKPDDTIEIDLDELDATSAELKARD